MVFTVSKSTLACVSQNAHLLAAGEAFVSISLMNSKQINFSAYLFGFFRFSFNLGLRLNFDLRLFLDLGKGGGDSNFDW